MAIDLITANPDENNPATIATEIDLFVQQIKTAIPQINDTAAALTLNSVNGTSSTSVAIGTGSKSFTANTGKSWQPGMWLSVADTAAPSTNAMYGVVTSYNSGTGALVINSIYIIGSGTKTSWVISQSSPSTQPIGLVLLSTVTASASATVDLETTFDSAYDEYMISATAVDMSAGTLYCRMKLGGTYAAGTYRYHMMNLSSGSATYAAAVSNAASQIVISATSGTHIDFTMTVKNPTSTTLRKLINWQGSHMSSTPNLYAVIGSGTNDSTSALTGIRFLLGAGNIASGTFRLYGVRKT